MTKADARDLEALRDAREARRERSRGRERALVIAGAIVVGVLFVVFVVVPTVEEVRDTRRFEVAHAAVAALFAEDRAAFEALLAEDAPAGAYAAAREVVAIADPARITRGHVTDAAAGVVTAEGYEIVVPVTDDLCVVPDLTLRPFQWSGARVLTGDDPIREGARAAVIAVYDDDRETFEALHLGDGVDEAWAASRELVAGHERPEDVYNGWSMSAFEGDDFDRRTRTFSAPGIGGLRVAMQRVGNRWFVDGPITTTR